MRVGRKASVSLAVAVLSLATGCGTSDSTAEAGTGKDAKNTASADERAREVVQNYLDAMKAKDVAKGKKQVCPAGHQKFDQQATGEDGDFNADYTVNEATITKVETSGDDERKVSATIVVKSKDQGANAVKANVTFKAQELGDIWCIFDSGIEGTPTPAAG